MTSKRIATIHEFLVKGTHRCQNELHVHPRYSASLSVSFAILPCISVCHCEIARLITVIPIIVGIDAGDLYRSRQGVMAPILISQTACFVQRCVVREWIQIDNAGWQVFMAKPVEMSESVSVYTNPDLHVVGALILHIDSILFKHTRFDSIDKVM